MSFVKRPYASMTMKKGDAASRVVVLRDTQPYGKTNGIYVDLNTSTALETFIGTLEPELDGVITKYASGEGTYEDVAKVVPNDTKGDSLTQVFKASFSDSSEKCTIIIPWFKATGNVATIAAAIKVLDFKDEAGSALTVNAVAYSATA